MPIYEWAETKRSKNLESHKLDFQDVDLVFESDHMVSEAYADPKTGEARFIASGYLSDLAVEVVFCRRGEAIRVISFHPVKRSKREKLNAALQQRRTEGDASPGRITDRPRASKGDDG